MVKPITTMTHDTNIPQGYKATALGIIPQEWEVRSLDYLGDIYSGGTPDTEVAEYWDGDIAWCTPSDITKLTSKYIENTEIKITGKGLKDSSAILLPRRSIIVCTRATIGNAAICNTEIATNQGFKNVVPSNDTNPEWLYYIIMYSKPRLVRLGCGSTFLEVSKKDFSRFKIVAPPLEEQRKIAEVLGVWDEAIEKQMQLIEKFALRKRGLMQRLLSAKLRLPGFSEPWQKVKLGKIGKFDKGYGVPKESIRNTGNKAITYGEIYTKHYFVIKKFTSYIDDETAAASKKITQGAILFTGSGETLEDIGKCVAFIDNDIAYAGGDIIIFNPSIEINSLVLSYCLNSAPVNAQKATYGQGHSVVHIYQKDLAKLQVTIPSFSEQNAIAEVLTAADREIELAKEKLERLRRQKRGLMQQLLSGKKRVK